MMGVDYELFWNLNPNTLKPFVKAFSLQQKNINYTAWLNGVYVRNAIVSAMSKNVKYPSKPIEGTSSSSDVKDKFLNMVNRVNKKFEGGLNE